MLSGWDRMGLNNSITQIHFHTPSGPDTAPRLDWLEEVPVIICNPSFLFKARKNQRLGGTPAPQYHIYSNNNVTALSPTAADHCSYLMIINIQYMTGQQEWGEHSFSLIVCFSQQAAITLKGKFQMTHVPVCPSGWNPVFLYLFIFQFQGRCLTATSIR